MSEASEAPPTLPQRLFAAATIPIAAAAGLALLDRWIAPGTVPGAESWTAVWPALLLGSAALILLVAGARRAGLAATATGLLAWAFGVLVVTELPMLASTYTLGDGPWLVPVYIVAALAAGLYATGWQAHRVEDRIACVLLFLTSANGSAFSRGEGVLSALLVVFSAFALVCTGRHLGLGELLRGPGRLLAWIAGGFVAWTLAASLFAVSPTFSLRIWANVLSGVLIALTLAGGLDRRGAARAFGALIAGLVLAIVVLVVGVLEASSSLGYEWIAKSRLRLYDLHPGLIAPYLAVGICIAIAFARSQGLRGSRTRAWLGLGLLSALGVALILNFARASLLGAAVGVAAYVLAATGRLPRKPLLWGVAVLALVLGGVGFLVSPLGAPVRASLEAKAQTASALGQRYHYWQMAGGAVKRDPLFGQGLRSEWARTDLAAPSHLDGSDQDLHAHNLLFSVAEAAGIPAAVLLILLILGALETARRAVMGAESKADRAIAAGLFAGLAAQFAANVLSMGQAWTIVPLYLWTAIGLCAALLRRPGAEPGRTSPGLRVVVLSAFVGLFGAAPLFGWFTVERGREALSVQDAELAFERFDRALRFDPLNRAVEMDAAQALFAGGRVDDGIVHIEAACDSAPRRANWWFTLGAAQIAAVRLDDAARSFSRAVELDPRGKLTGDFHAAWARAELLRGDIDAAREQLTEALRRNSVYWRLTPITLMPPKPGDPSDAMRIGFPVGDPAAPTTTLTLDERLEVLAGEVRQALAREPQDLRTARRLLGTLVEAYRYQRVWAEPLALMEEYASLVPERYSSTDTQYVRLLADAGRYDEADAIASGTPGKRSHIPNVEILRYYGTRMRKGAGPKILERAQAIALELDEPWIDDPWFSRGSRHEIAGFLAELALRRGDLEAMYRFRTDQLFDLPEPNARAQACLHLLRVAVQQGADETVLTEMAVETVRYARMARNDMRTELGMTLEPAGPPGTAARDQAFAVFEGR